jgi:hypothetical protein
LDISLLYDSIARGSRYNFPQVQWKWNNYAITPNEIFKKKLYTRNRQYTYHL